MAKGLYEKGDEARLRVIRDDPDEPYRTPWRRDYARLAHSAAFRRLQGKTQLFPNDDSDFFRTRLTHSFEVAQVAKSIAIRLNAIEPMFGRNINTDIVETAALAHDLGHPPFGHNGESALDECMKDSGGFEGNAQTLRIIARIEKRDTSVREGLEYVVRSGKVDARIGLNLTARTLASVLKYDECIPMLSADRRSGKTKGYYLSEKAVVDFIRAKVRAERAVPLKVIECSIMDIADDIAYSTYDLEDAFKSNFLNPMSVLRLPEEILVSIASEVNKTVQDQYPGTAPITPSQVVSVFTATFERYVPTFESIRTNLGNDDVAFGKDGALAAALEIFNSFQKLATSGYYRSELTSRLVGEAIKAVTVVPNKKPWLSQVKLSRDRLIIVESLKHLAYRAVIQSPMLKMSEYKGKDIVTSIFDALASQGDRLLPSDFRELFNMADSKEEQRRVVCDFIAGMTDRYCINMYSRLYGVSPESIFTPM